MPRQISPPTPALNRLRAAAGLVTLIEAGLTSTRLSRGKAILMLEYCHEAAEHDRKSDPEMAKLTNSIKEGIERLNTLLA